MTNGKPSPEETYALYAELYKKKRRIETTIDRLQKKLEEPQQELNRLLERLKSQLSDDLIDQASKDYEMEVLQRINYLVAKQNNLAEAVQLLSALERHFQLRLNPAVKPADKAEPAPKPKTVSAPTPSSPAEEKPETKETPSGKPRERHTIVEGRLAGLVRYRYDQLGRTVTEDYYDGQGNKIGSWERVYDPEGKLQSLIGRNRLGVLLEEAVFEYNPAGKISNEIIRDNKNVLLWSCSYNYDRASRLGKRVWRDNRGKVTKSWEYHYAGESDKATSVVWKDEHNHPFGSSEYTYDEAGFLIVETRKDKRGEILKVLDFHYRF